MILEFENLSLTLGNDYESILGYFEENYIGKFSFVNLVSQLLVNSGCLRRNNTRKNPLFNINFWNMFNRTSQASIRTNNAAEAYHRRIGSVFQCSHPTL